MKQEYSYGAVVYRVDHGEIQILLEFMNQGHISLPKGHIEAGETPEGCAKGEFMQNKYKLPDHVKGSTLSVVKCYEAYKREIKEETDLDCAIDTSFSHTISYSPVKGVKKDVTFFLATPLSNHIKPQIEEVTKIVWVSYYRALDLLTHRSDKEVLRDAIKHIEEKLKDK